jgi:adenine phosphoribosyltransferase
LEWLRYAVLRKVYKPYMGVALSAETLSITTGEPQMLFLDEKDHDLLRGTQVLLLDDVISTGSTLHGMRLLMEKAGAEVVQEAGIFTEGDRDKWQHIISLGHLPVFTGNRRQPIAASGWLSSWQAQDDNRRPAVVSEDHPLNVRS